MALHCATQEFILRMIENPNNRLRVGKWSYCRKHVTGVTCSGKQIGALYIVEYALQGSTRAIVHRTTQGPADARTMLERPCAAWAPGETMVPLPGGAKIPMVSRFQIASRLGPAQTRRRGRSSGPQCCPAPTPTGWCAPLGRADAVPTRPRGRTNRFRSLGSSRAHRRAPEDAAGTPGRSPMHGRCIPEVWHPALGS